MVEHENVPGDHKKHFRQVQIVLTCRRNFCFEKTDRFITKETNGAASEPWQLRMRNELIPPHQFVQFVEWICVRGESFFDPVSHDAEVAPVALNNQSRLKAHE